MKKRRLHLYTLDVKYVRDLANADNRVMSVSPQQHKENRPFVGIIIIMKQHNYCIPMTSPKPKHNKMKNDLDFSKILDSNNCLIGALNFNNMIPVTSKNYIEFDLNKRTTDKKEMLRIELLRNQLRFLTLNRKEVNRKSKLLYSLYKNNKLPKNVRDRCCNFPLLEEKCRNFSDVTNAII